jgi:predicted nucleotidyltransferase
LKLIAFDDRLEKRSKDARDIANIISRFFDFRVDIIYEKHTDLFAAEANNQPLAEIEATVIGREIKKISAPSIRVRQKNGSINIEGKVIFCWKR